LVLTGIEIIEFDTLRENVPLPGLGGWLQHMKLGHHFPGEQLKAFANMLMRRFAGLIEKNDLIDMRVGVLAQLVADGQQGRAEERAGKDDGGDGPVHLSSASVRAQAHQAIAQPRCGHAGLPQRH
jgi:hypothetical protein